MKKLIFYDSSGAHIFSIDVPHANQVPQQGSRILVTGGKVYVAESVTWNYDTLVIKVYCK